MRNKEICRKCWIDEDKVFYILTYNKNNGFEEYWNMIVKEKYDKKLCKDCKYKLEQIVSEK